MRQFPVVGILGARQVGKTTLARQLVEAHRGPVTYFDLESAEDLARLADPMLALRPLTGLIVLDEVQRRPDLFTQLRVLVDEPRTRRKFLVLGSASPDLLRQTSETLAGRIAYHELGGFSLEEVGLQQWSKLWHRGGFPRSFLARSEPDSLQWRKAMIRTFLERDIPALGLRLPAATLRRFWMMLAHYHATGVERLRVRPVVRGRPHHGATLPRSAQRDLHGPAAPRVAREHRQAAGQGPEGLPQRQRPASCSSRSRQRRRHRVAPESRSLVGGLRPRCGRDATRSASGRVPFLGGPLRSGARPARRPGQRAARIRVQEDHGAGHDALDARRPRGPPTVAGRRRPCGIAFLPDAPEDPSDRAEPSARRISSR